MTIHNMPYTNFLAQFFLYLKQKKILKSKGELAEKVGLSRQYVTSVLNGSLPLSDSFVHSFTNAFQDEYKEFLDFMLGNISRYIYVRVQEAAKALELSDSDIARQLNVDIEVVRDIPKHSTVDYEFVNEFAQQFNINIEWLKNRHYPFSLDPEIQKQFEKYRQRKVDALEKRLGELRIIEEAGPQKKDEKQSEFMSVLHEIELISSEIGSIYGEISAELEAEKLFNAGDERIIGRDIFSIEPHTKTSKVVNMGRQEQALMIPFIHKYYYKKYPKEARDENFISGLPRHVFMLHSAAPKAYLRALEIIDSSMDDGSVNSICEGDIVVGVERTVNDPLFDSPIGVHSNTNFIIITNEDVLCRSLRRVYREEGYIEYFAKNPDKETYPDLKIQIDDIQELYWIRRIERSKL